jgi:hypothetical protein
MNATILATIIVFSRRMRALEVDADKETSLHSVIASGANACCG